MKIGILQAGHAPQNIIDSEGDYEHLFRRLLAGKGFDFQTWNVVDMDFPASPRDADGWLITGSKHGVYEDHDFIAPLEDLIRDITRSDRPLIGVCFGHQIIAQALGGDVRKFDGGWSVGNTEYSGALGALHLNAWHQDQVITPPDGAKTLAGNDFCAHGVLLYEGKALTIQPHPEFASSVIGGLIATRGKGIIPDPLLANATENLDAPNSNKDIADIFAQFFKTKSLS